MAHGHKDFCQCMDCLKEAALAYSERMAPPAEDKIPKKPARHSAQSCQCRRCQERRSKFEERSLIRKVRDEATPKPSVPAIVARVPFLKPYTCLLNGYLMPFDESHPLVGAYR